LAIGNGTASDTTGILTAAQFKASANGSGASLAFGINGNNGLFVDTQGNLRFTGNSNASTFVTSNGFMTIGFNSPLGFASSNTAVSIDTGISRLGAASLAIGNGTAGDFTGALKLGNITLTSAAPTVAAAQIGYGSTVSATANTTGGGLTLPLLAAGYIIVNIAGTAYKVPYYAS
jgi:hypothetical protein